MQTRNRNTFTTIHTEGALLPFDLLQRIRSNDANLEGLDAESYHLAPGEKLNEAINRSWNRLNGLWGAFQAARGRLGSNDAGTTLTRERWLLPLFQELGFGRLSTSKAVEIEGKSYPISHRWQNVPLHLVGCGIELDKRTPGAAGASRTSPHSLLQEYLNRSDDAQWGLVSNGLNLRVLRDNATLTRQAYIEFDLESMFDGEVYSDFILLWLICHQSRFETTEKQAECILERWSKSAQESGTRALDDLRAGVEGAIVSLGQGFLQYPLNGDLRSRLIKGDLSAQDYYRQLLRLVYRLIFLFAAEDRDLLLLPEASVDTKQRFQNYYSTTRLRMLAMKQRGSRHHDRYESLRLVMILLGSDQGCPELAIPALGGFLFDSHSTSDLNDVKLDNQSLLASVRSLAFITEGNTSRAVDYRNLGPEELGSVYESLLELHPLLNVDAGTFQLISAAGNERKTTGSYYTPTSLIQVLLDSALDPIIENRLKAQADAAQQEQALLLIKVCDPACGSGHFLIAAAHRITGKLAEVRAGGNEPSPKETRRALRDVIRHCIYGVDINPMAVELCKVNLWLESLEPEKPLSFLDAHIKCGNSLVGVGPKMELNDLEVPDEAFNPVTSDHKATAALLKKRNRQEREGQESLFVAMIKSQEDLDQWLAERTRTVEAMPEDNAIEVQAKAEAYTKVNESAEYRKRQQIADLWTSAFFWKIEEISSSGLAIAAPTHGQLRRLRNGSHIQNGLLEQAEKIRNSEGFFHWPLEFAEITRQGGFDCVLGNPPWELLQLEEQEYFASLNPEIANLPGDQRKKAIADLEKTNPSLALAFEEAKHNADAINKFLRYSGCYPLTTNGKMNTYAIFAEGFKKLLSINGQAGIIVPTGIATDHSTRFFFQDLVNNKNLVSLYDFENGQAIFPSVERNVRFCLLSISIKQQEIIQLSAQLQSTDGMKSKGKIYRLSSNDIRMVNPNTQNCPMFGSNLDAQIVVQIHKHIPVLVNIPISANPWGVQFRQGLFNMTSDSSLFKTLEKITEIGYQLNGNTFRRENSEVYLPLYESKLMHQYNHRAATFKGTPISERFKIHAGTKEPSKEDLENPNFQIIPRYWVPEREVVNFTDKNRKWFLGFRNAISATADSRSLVATILPWSGIGNSMPILFVDGSATNSTLILGMLNSIVLDYVLKQKASGGNLNFYIVEQLPVLPPENFKPDDLDYIVPRVLELVYSAYDLKPFAEDMGYHGEPFRWDEDRRALLRAELDAYYAKLYGLNRDELRYILDPQDVYGPDFPGETFRVLKDKEIRQFGEYRTRRLVLEAWDRLEASGELPQGVQVESVLEGPTRVEVPEPEHPVTPMPQPDKSPVKHEPKPSQIDDAQPALGDMVLYKCAVCGKMVMGFDRGNHVHEKHSGQSVEWKRVGK